MAIARRAAGNGTPGTASFSVSPNAGDFLLFLMENTASSTTPSISGSTSIAAGSDSTNGLGMRMAYLIASGGDSMPSFNFTTTVAWAIYSGVNTSAPVVQAAGQSGTTSTISTSGIVTYQNPGVDWVVIGAVGKGITGNIGSHPFNSVSLVTEYKSGSDDNALFDSNTPLSSYSFNSKTLDAAVPWISKIFELVAASGSSPQSVTLPLISSTSSLFVPTLSLVLNVPLLASSTVLYAFSIALGPITAVLPLLASSTVLYAPTVTPQPVTISLPDIASTTQLDPPTVVPTNDAQLPLISSVAQLYAPTVTPQPVTLDLPFLATAESLFDPIITVGALGVMLPFISDEVLYSPVVRRAIDPNELLLLGVG